MLGIFAFSLFTSCQHGNVNGSGEMIRLDHLCLKALTQHDYHTCDSIASILYSKADLLGNKHYLSKALYYLGTYNRKKEEAPARLKKLQQALDIAQKEQDDTLQCRIYNALGAYEVDYFKRYYMAQQYLSKAMELGRKTGQKSMEMVAECNLSEIYRMLGDTMGIRYDKEILDYAQEKGIRELSRAAAVHCASYYTSRAKDISTLKPYLDVLREDPKDTSLIHILEAEFYMQHGDLKDADALVKLIPLNIDDYSEVLIVYARILNMQGHYVESNKVLNKVVNSQTAIQETYNGIDAYKIYADNYHSLGNNALAFSYLDRYDILRDSVTQRIHSEQINMNRVKYEVGKKDQEIEQQRLLNRQQLIVASAIIIILIVALIAYYLYERRYKRFARNIVQQHKEALATEKLLRQRIEKGFKAKDISGKTKDTSGISDAKLDEIFEKIRIEMEEHKIYCDTTVTRDMFSERVGCSHTYLTYAIKAKTGMSYSQFMNSYRIRKAVEILSDNNQTITLKELSKKLGFIAVSTFYSVFQRQVGISPAAYRKTAMEMNAEKEEE